jgi:hypothetical protein
MDHVLSCQSTWVIVVTRITSNFKPQYLTQLMYAKSNLIRIRSKYRGKTIITQSFQGQCHSNLVSTSLNHALFAGTRAIWSFRVTMQDGPRLIPARVRMLRSGPVTSSLTSGDLYTRFRIWVMASCRPNKPRLQLCLWRGAVSPWSTPSFQTADLDGLQKRHSENHATRC